MRVLTVYYKHRPGGMMQMLYRMLLGGAERGWDMHYLAVEPYRISHPRLHPHLLRAWGGHSSLLFWAWFFCVTPFAALLTAWRQRIELLAVFEGAYAWTVLPVKWLLRVPMVVFLQSDVATINRMHGRHSAIRRFEQWMEGASLRRADHVIATNQALADLVRKRWNLADERISVVPNNARAPQPVSAEARRRLADEIGLPADAFVVATSGVFSPRKNLSLLLRAFAESDAANAHLVVIGQGTDEASWRATMGAARSGGNGARIHFLGWREDVGAVLAGCDLFVFPTRHEGSPLSLIEALRAGLPCLGSDIPEIREVLGNDTACLFDPDDVEPLRARIETAAGDVAARDNLRAITARRASVYDFDWEATVTRTLENAAASRRGQVSVRDSAEARLVRLYERATGTRATARSAAAVSRFGPYLAGMVVAKGLSTAGQILISRLLGPSEFGRLAVVLATSTLVALPLAGAWGSTFVRYAAGQPRDTWAPLLSWISRKTFISASLLALSIAAVSPLLAALLDVPAGLLVAGAGLGVAMAAWLFAKAACQGREDWRRFVSSELGFGAATVAMPCLLLLFGALSWWQATIVFLAAYLLGAWPARALLSAARRMETSAVRSSHSHGAAAEYGRFVILTAATNTLFLYGDRFAAQQVLGFAEVGVYQVYNFATVGVAMLLATMLYNFVFPLFPQGDRRAFAALFRSGFVRLLPLTLTALFAAGWVQIHLSGFPFRPGLLAMATLSAAAFMLAGFYGQLVLSLGVNGSQLTAKVAAATLIVFAIGVVPAVRLGGLVGLFALYAVIYTGLAFFYAQALRHLTAEAAPSPATVAPLP